MLKLNRRKAEGLSAAYIILLIFPALYQGSLGLCHLSQTCIPISLLYSADSQLRSAFQRLSSCVMRPLGKASEAAEIGRASHSFEAVTHLKLGPLQGATAAEWKECHAASLLIGKKGAEMADQVQRSACMLVMEYVPGAVLFHVQKPFEAERLEQTAADLGRYGSCLSKPYSHRHDLQLVMPMAVGVADAETIYLVVSFSVFLQGMSVHLT